MSVLRILLLLTLFGGKCAGQRAKVTLISSNEELAITSKQCRSGAFFRNSSSFNCACITGVWGFYPKFCNSPAMFMGGDEYCFRVNHVKMTQVAMVGSFRYPFAPSLNHFFDKYIRLSATVTEEEQKTFLDAYGSWVTITDTSWTIYSDENDDVCLTPTISGTRIYCLFSEGLDAALDDEKWNTIIRVKQGCHSSKSVKADACYRIQAPNDRSNCDEFPTGRDKEVTGSGWIPLYPPWNSPKSKANISSPFGARSDGMDWMPTTGPPKSIDELQDNPSNSTSASEENWIRKPKAPKLGGRIENMPLNNTIASEEIWVPLPKPPKKNETKNITCEELTRDSIKKYWLDPANNECAKSINEAVFTDQLRRYAVTRLEKVFDSRLHSLEQMGQLLSYARDITKKVCGALYVPLEFFDVAADAFTMFMREDFFYQGEEVESVSFDRILKSLRNCLKRAKPFVFETQPLGCGLKKITGELILPGEKVNVTIPANGKSKNFEPLIETTWKMFTNAHSYCFEDFQFFNDHHHFSIQFLGLFSRTIYEKWIEPLRNKELYKFILPQFQALPEIMENLDYCVAATSQISKCPVWLTRSSPMAKSLVPVAGNSVRRKRSIWRDRIERARDRTKIWDGKAYCVQTMEEPSVSLGYFKECNQVF